MHTQTCSRNQELTVRILLINIQTQGGSEITDGVLTIRQEIWAFYEDSLMRHCHLFLKRTKAWHKTREW